MLAVFVLALFEIETRLCPLSLGENGRSVFYIDVIVNRVIVKTNKQTDTVFVYYMLCEDRSNVVLNLFALNIFVSDLCVFACKFAKLT